MIRRLLLKYDDKLIKTLNYQQYQYLQKLFGFPVVRERFKRRTGYTLNLRNPSSFNEKLTFRQLYKKDPRIPFLCDKFRVRELVTKKTPDIDLIPLLGVYERAQDIDFDQLPAQFMIKTNFMSGGNILVEDKARMDHKSVIWQLREWMGQKYGYSKLDWYVQEIPKKILIEQLMQDEQGKIPVDYKFFVFHGKVRFVEVHADRFTAYSRCFYDPDWNRLEVSYRSTKNAGKAPDQARPRALEKMILLAEKLAEDFDFMRVDLYCIKGRVYFGEYTLTPVNGCARFEPREFDRRLGDLWQLST